jgi:hypothetical protein
MSSELRCRCAHKLVPVYAQTVRYGHPILMKQNYHVPTIFSKLHDVKFNENLFGGSVTVTSGQTDGHGETNGRILQFRHERA